MKEGELRVSQRELHRMHVVRLSVGRGAKLLGISPHQMKRLRRKMKERGSWGGWCMVTGVSSPGTRRCQRR